MHSQNTHIIDMLAKPLRLPRRLLAMDMGRAMLPVCWNMKIELS